MTVCELCERPAPGYLCLGCRSDLGERLEQLPALLDRLADMLLPVRSSDGGRRGAAVVARPPADLDVIERRWGFAILPSWHRALLDDRGLPPAPVGEGLDRQVAAACAGLRDGVDWAAAEWPAAGDLAREVRDLYDDTRSVVGAVDLPARMGRCPAVVHGSPCGAELLLPDGVQVLRCPWCGATYPPGVWAALRVAQRTAGLSGAAALVAAAAGPSRA